VSAPAPGTPHDDAAPGRPSYAPGARAAAAGAMLLAVLLLVAAYRPGLGDGVRSACFGGGLVLLSAGATVLVAAQLFRTAPAATAPALAALYLIKVLAFGWLLLVPGTPPWLAPGTFLTAVLTVLAATTVGSAVLAHRVSMREARLVAAAAPAAPSEKETP